MCRAAYCFCLSLLEGPSSGTILGRRAALGRHTAAHKDDKMHVSDDPFCKSGSLLSRSRHQQVHTRFISVPGACACVQRLTPTTVAIDWLGHGAVNAACAKLDPTSLDFTESLRFALLTDDSVFILHKFVNVLGGLCNAEGSNQS